VRRARAAAAHVHLCQLPVSAGLLMLSMPGAWEEVSSVSWGKRLQHRTGVLLLRRSPPPCKNMRFCRLKNGQLLIILAYGAWWVRPCTIWHGERGTAQSCCSSSQVSDFVLRVQARHHMLV
jgi:hypothetical protein